MQEAKPDTPKKLVDDNEDDCVMIEPDEEEMIDTSTVPKHDRQRIWDLQAKQRGPTGEY